MAILKNNRHMRVFAEIHQNGVQMASIDRPLWRRASLKITNHYRGDLALPLYPLSKDIDFLKVHGKSATFHSDQPWDGILTSQGVIHNLSASNRRQIDLELYPGDYASLNLGDLTLLIKIAKPQQKLVLTKHDTSYRGSVLSLIMGTKIEKQILAFSFLLSLILFGGFIAGLLSRPDDRPRKFEDLSSNYILPFVAPEHLLNAPEVLQFNIDRSRLIHSVVDYCRAYTEMLLGVAVKNSRYLPSPVIDLYKDWFSQQDQEIQQLSEDRIQLNRKALEENGAALISFPGVVGETYQGKLLRIIDKMEVNHYGKALTLNKRRVSTEEIAKDPSYDYVNYKEKRGMDEKVLKQLATIRPWQTLTDEGLMYAEAQRLAKLAKTVRENRQNASKQNFLTALDSRAIVLDPKLGITSFNDSFGETNFDTKLHQLSGKSYAAPKKSADKEPLIGELEPELVRKLIKNQGYELKLCYELGLRRNPHLQGYMDWRWIIDSRGTTREVLLVESEIRDTQLSSCISEKIGRWRFPRPRRGSVEITHRFNFSPRRF